VQPCKKFLLIGISSLYCTWPSKCCFVSRVFLGLRCVYCWCCCALLILQLFARKTQTPTMVTHLLTQMQLSWIGKDLKSHFALHSNSLHSFTEVELLQSDGRGEYGYGITSCSTVENRNHVLKSLRHIHYFPQCGNPICLLPLKPSFLTSPNTPFPIRTSTFPYFRPSMLPNY